MWWHSLTEEECPITLEPLSSLPFPPFGLHRVDNSKWEESSSQGHAHGVGYKYYFDGHALASYMVSRGVFENPLTREPLVWDDCRRLDKYLEQYSTGRTSVRVCEAFSLKQSIHVKRQHQQTGTSQSQHELEERRAEFLRREATTALLGLFVYRRGGRSNTEHNDTNTKTSQSSNASSPPKSGFNLNAGRPNNSTVLQMEGLTIIDDDEVIPEDNAQEEWKQLQEAFPMLTNNHAIEGSASVPSSGMLEKVRATAAQSRSEEERRRLLLERCRIRLEQKAQDARKERQRQAQLQRELQKQAYDEKTQIRAELARAREEIEQWREEQWETLRLQCHVAQKSNEEKHRASESPPLHALNTSVDQEQSKAPTKTPENGDGNIDNSEASVDALVGEVQDKKAAAKARKRRRERERKKVKKAEEQAAALAQKKKQELHDRRNASSKRCANCSKGILGAGFERLGLPFCSTKCARAGGKTEPS